MLIKDNISKREHLKVPIKDEDLKTGLSKLLIKLHIKLLIKVLIMAFIKLFIKLLSKAKDSKRELLKLLLSKDKDQETYIQSLTNLKSIHQYPATTLTVLMIYSSSTAPLAGINK